MRIVTSPRSDRLGYANENAIYFVGEHEEDPKIFEHPALCDRLQVQHSAHGCKSDE
jgi:hypothetical protein